MSAIWEHRDGVVTSAQLRKETQILVRESQAVAATLAHSIECSLRARLRGRSWQIGARAVDNDIGGIGSGTPPTLLCCSASKFGNREFVEHICRKCREKRVPDEMLQLVKIIAETLADDRYYRKLGLFSAVHVFENRNANICVIQTASLANVVNAAQPTEVRMETDFLLLLSCTQIMPSRNEDAPATLTDVPAVSTNRGVVKSLFYRLKARLFRKRITHV